MPQKVYVDIELPENEENDDEENHKEIEAEVEDLADDLNKIQALVSGSYTVSFEKYLFMFCFFLLALSGQKLGQRVIDRGTTWTKPGSHFLNKTRLYIFKWTFFSNHQTFSKLNSKNIFDVWPTYVRICRRHVTDVVC